MSRRRWLSLYWGFFHRALILIQVTVPPDALRLLAGRGLVFSQHHLQKATLSIHRQMQFGPEIVYTTLGQGNFVKDVLYLPGTVGICQGTSHSNAFPCSYGIFTVRCGAGIFRRAALWVCIFT